MREKIFLMPPSNFKLFKEIYPDLNASIFFKKINLDSLKTIKPNDPYFDHDLVYKRREEVMWHEQFGRRVFEFILLGKKIYFGNDPLMIKDGFSDYLWYYDIKTKNGEVTTKPEELSERMEDRYGRYLLCNLNS